ncbi:MAG: DUF502 domain-containing protein [Chloroflexi bacterium]|nr:DUF502 domain-containing protein [Chloroflexota bacterium]
MTKDEMLARLARARVRTGVLAGQFRNRLVTGLVLIIPLAVTIFIIRFLWEFLYNFLLPLFDVLEGHIPFISGAWLQFTIVVIILGFLYFLGSAARSVVGTQVVRIWHGTIESIPVVRSFYRVVRQVVDMFASDNPLSNQPVVVLEYPRIGALALGMVTSRFVMPDGEEYLTVYIPTIPIPSSGYMTFVKEDEVTPTDITFDEAMRIIFSGGVLSQEITREHYERRQRLENGENGAGELAYEPDRAMMD